MSLTSHLKQTQSPVSQFFAKNYPGAKTLARKATWQLKDASTIRPVGEVPYGTIGTAVDYRLRYYFQLTPCQELAAWHGASMLCGRPISQSDGIEVVFAPHGPDEPVLPLDLVDNYFASLNSVLSDMQPVGRRLERPQEELLARYCIVLALFEEIFRAAPQNSPLVGPKFGTVDALLAVAQPHWVEDLCRLSWLFYDRFSNVLSAPVVLNLTFDGSNDIGGADADLILDGYLLDIKTTINAIIKPQWLHQLMGYVLLDYSDSYQFRGVGLYLARQGVLLQWPLSEFVRELRGEEALSLKELRLQFRELLPVRHSDRLDREG